MAITKATDTKGKTWTKDEIAQLLQTNDKALERAILKIFARQTASEQAIDTTTHTNGKGFTSADARLLSSFAKWIQTSHKAEGSRLSDKQKVWARKKMAKYAGQMLLVMKETAAATVQTTLNV